MSSEQSSSGFVKNPTYERYRWQIFGITWLAYAGFYLTRKSFSVAKVVLTECKALDLSWVGVVDIASHAQCTVERAVTMTSSQMAWIDFGYLLAYACGQFLWGISGDKFGTRKVILGGMLISVIAGFLMGASSVAIMFGVFFLIQGLCQSTGWAPLSKNISNFFSQHERGTIMGFWCTNYAVGGLIASAYAGYMADKFGWRYAFYVPAATLFVIWILFFFLQRNKPEDVGLPSIEAYHNELPQLSDEEQKEEDEAEEGSWASIAAVFKNPMVLLLAGVYFFLKPTRYAVLFWGPKYINHKLGSGALESGILSALFELAGPLSVLFGGIISDKVFNSKRMPISVICLFLLAGLLFVMDSLPANHMTLGASFFLLGILLYAPDSLVSGTAAIDFGQKKGASTAAGLINGCGSVGAIIGGTIPGFFAKQWGWGGVFNFLGCSVLMAALLLLPKWNALPKGTEE